MRSLLSELPLAFGPKWVDPDFLIETFGTLGILAIVFIESGLLVGLFLPGDSLLFTAGVLSANDTLPDLWILLALIPLAAIAGDQVGYVIGRRAGQAVFRRPDSRFFKHEHVQRSQAFFDRHGPRKILIARFVPIVPTIAPVMAGVANMRYRTFLIFSKSRQQQHACSTPKCDLVRRGESAPSRAERQPPRSPAFVAGLRGMRRLRSNIHPPAGALTLRSAHIVEGVPMSDTLASLREHNRAVWSSGDWDVMATHIAPAGPRLLDRLDVGRRTRLLDVGTGSGGSVAIPAAQRGATVTGADITDAWFAAARRRATDAGVDVEWVVADAAQLPFPDDAFDVVTSTFGHMFAPDHAAAARELARVCRPGGAVGLCCWTPEGNAGQMFARLGSHMPPPPEGFQPPPLWGSDPHVRALLEPLGFTLELRREQIVLTFASPQEQADTMEHNFGPIVTAKAALGDGWPAVRADLDAFMAERNEAHDGTMVSTNEYLEIVGRLESEDSSSL